MKNYTPHQPQAKNIKLSPIQIICDLIAGLAVGLGSGYYLDNWLKTKPLFIILCTILGCTGGFYNIYKAAVYSPQQKPNSSPSSGNT